MRRVTAERGGRGAAAMGWARSPLQLVENYFSFKNESACVPGAAALRPNERGRARVHLAPWRVCERVWRVSEGVARERVCRCRVD